MSNVEITTAANGPFLVTGPVTIKDTQGNVYDLGGKAKVALCRCGESGNKPFCDGSHKGCGFVSEDMVPNR